MFYILLYTRKYLQDNSGNGCSKTDTSRVTWKFYKTGRREEGNEEKLAIRGKITVKWSWKTILTKSQYFGKYAFYQEQKRQDKCMQKTYL